jgi:transposase
LRNGELGSVVQISIIPLVNVLTKSFTSAVPKLGFGRVVALEKGRPCYHPATLLKIYIYGYLNRIPSSRRLERECQRNIELV